MKNFQKTLCALTVVMTSLPALAESVDVQVIGTITPAACTPTINGGGVIDYGTIRPDTLSDTDYTVLPVMNVGISISCDAPAKVALMASSGRPGTVAGVTTEYNQGQATAPAGVTIFGSTGISVVGLGLDGAAKIGGYGLRITNILLDGNTATGIARHPTGTDWIGNGSGQMFDRYYARLLSFGDDAATGPKAFEQMSGDVGVQAYLNKASELDLTKPVRLDGLTTIEMVYL